MVMIDDSRETLIELQSVSAGYGNGLVLRDVNLKVREQDFIGVIGANGSGKTTLIKVILGLLKPAGGEIIVKNRGLRTGYMPQLANIDREFPVTVEDVVLSGLISEGRLLRGYTREQKAEAAETMEKIGIAAIGGSGLNEISGGQLQKAFLARAVVGKPEILILDEPDAFIDKDSEKGFYGILRELNKSVAILLVSHNLGVISSYVKSIACVGKTLHYHDSGELSQKILDEYACPVDVITHGTVPHRVLREHNGVKGGDRA